MKTTKTKLAIKELVAVPLRWRCFLFALWSGFVRRTCRKIKKILRRRRFSINAVSYRIPRAVTTIIQYHDGNRYPICPRCSKSMDREYVTYCDRCGQRLGWRHFDRAEVSYPAIKR